jgi:hypothetical protein
MATFRKGLPQSFKAMRHETRHVSELDTGVKPTCMLLT